MTLIALLGIAVILMAIGMGIFFIGRYFAKKNNKTHIDKSESTKK